MGEFVKIGVRADMTGYLSLQEQAYNYLLGVITGNGFDEKKLYSLSAVADELGMSKTPVRDAIQKLSQENLIEILPSRGFRLRTPSKTDIIRIFQLRCAIEGYCSYNLAQLCQNQQTHPALAVMEECLSQQEEIIKSFPPDADHYLLVDRTFHGAIVSSINNSYFDYIISHNNERINSFALRSLKVPGFLDRTLKEHTDIYRTILTGDPVASQAAMIYHLNTPLKVNMGLYP